MSYPSCRYLVGVVLAVLIPVSVLAQDDPKTLSCAPDCRGADLAGADLADLNLNRVSLVNADLTDATLTGVSLVGADLTGATLFCTTVIDSDLTAATLTRNGLEAGRVDG